MDILATTVDGLVAHHNELLLEFDVHVARKYNPKWLGLEDAIAECSYLGIHDIIVAVVSNHVDLPIFTTDCILPESNGAVCKGLPVLFPVPIAPPAVVDGVAGSTASQMPASYVFHVAASQDKHSN